MLTGTCMKLKWRFLKKILFNIAIHSAMISQKLNESILKHTVIKVSLL